MRLVHQDNFYSVKHDIISKIQTSSYLQPSKKEEKRNAKKTNSTQFGVSRVHGGYSSGFTVSNGTERSSVASPASGPRGDDTDTASPQKLCRRPERRHDTERPPVASLASRSTYGHGESVGSSVSYSTNENTAILPAKQNDQRVHTDRSVATLRPSCVARHRPRAQARAGR